MCPREMPNATLFLVAILSGEPFNSPCSRDLWKQDKLGNFFAAPAPFFAFTLEATTLEVGCHEPQSFICNFLPQTLKFYFVLGSGSIKKPNVITRSQSTFETLLPIAVILNFSWFMRKSVTMPFPVSKTTLFLVRFGCSWQKTHTTSGLRQNLILKWRKSGMVSPFFIVFRDPGFFQFLSSSLHVYALILVLIALNGGIHILASKVK